MSTLKKCKSKCKNKQMPSKKSPKHKIMPKSSPDLTCQNLMITLRHKKMSKKLILKENQKKERLMELLTNGPPPPIIVFCNGKKGCDLLSRSLDKQGFPSVTIHSGKDQASRELAIDGFKSGEYDILVATDVVGRGIDIEGVEHVINYDMPKDIESYTHRIGRTGRAGRKGVATTFVTGEGMENNGVLYDLRMLITSCKQQVPSDIARLPAAQDAETRERNKKPKFQEAKSARDLGGLALGAELGAERRAGRRAQSVAGACKRRDEFI